MRTGKLKNQLSDSNKRKMIKVIPCPFCPFKTKYKSNLNYHIRIHTGERSFKCLHPQCQKSFITSSSLNRHEVVHTQEKNFKCSVCNKKFTRKSTLDKHKRIHLNEKPFACPQSPYTTNCNASLQSHMTHTHSDDRPFKCEECHYAAKIKGALNRHLKVHLCEEDKEHVTKHKCPHCPYKCPRSDTMKIHLRIHTGEKPFPCPHCPHKTTTSCQLKVHIAYRHTGEKKFQCEFCDFSSVTNSQLNDHIRTHTGEKPYKCSHCDYFATQNSSLKRHKQRIHKRQFRHMNNSIHTTKRIWGCKVRDCPFQTSKQKQLALHLNVEHKLPVISIEPIRNYSSSMRQSTKTHEKILIKKKISKFSSCSTKLNLRKNKVCFDIPAKSHQKQDERRPSHLPSRVFETHETSDPGRISVSYQTGKDAEVSDFNRLTISKCTVGECQFRSFEAKKLALHLNWEHQLPRVQLPKFNLIFV